MIKWMECLVILLFFVKGTVANTQTGNSFSRNQYSLLQEQVDVYSNLAAQNTWRMLPEGTCLQPGDSGAFVLALRHNLLLTGDLAKKEKGLENYFFDETLLEGVRNFQRRHGLLADGIVGQHTTEELRVNPERRVQQLLLNMERWQAFYASPAQPSVFVNIPDYIAPARREVSYGLADTRYCGAPGYSVPNRADGG